MAPRTREAIAPEGHAVVSFLTIVKINLEIMSVSDNMRPKTLACSVVPWDPATMTTARDVAAYIQAKVRYDRLKLHKLVYYAQAWSLAWENVPLFKEKIEAWPNGPVVRILWVEQKYPSGAPSGDLSVLTKAQRHIVDEVLRFYGGRDGAWLAKLTHREEPWRRARGVAPSGAKSEEPISHKSMRDYYGKQATALGAGKRLPDELRLGLDLLMSLADDEVDALYRDSSVPEEEELNFLVNGGIDPWNRRAS